MKTFSEAKAELQAEFGADLYMMINSRAFQAAVELVSRYSPMRNVARSISPAEVLQLGVVFAAQDQGFHGAIQAIESLADRDDAPFDPTFTPAYRDEPHEPENSGPAPEAPRPARRTTPKPQPKKKK